MSTTVDQYRSTILNTANQLTILRIVFVPVFIILLTDSHTGWALGVFMAGVLTDILDGIIARKFGQKTSIGAVLDPLADKLLMTTSIVLLSFPQMGFANVIPRWLMILMVSRDVLLFLVSLIVVLMVGWRLFKPSIYGKASTVTQAIMVFLVLYSNYRGVLFPELKPLFYLTGFLTAFSGIHYLVIGRKYLDPV